MSSDYIYIYLCTQIKTLFTGLSMYAYWPGCVLVYVGEIEVLRWRASVCACVSVSACASMYACASVRSRVRISIHTHLWYKISIRSCENCMIMQYNDWVICSSYIPILVAQIRHMSVVRLTLGFTDCWSVGLHNVDIHLMQIVSIYVYLSKF